MLRSREHRRRVDEWWFTPIIQLFWFIVSLVTSILLSVVSVAASILSSVIDCRIGAIPMIGMIIILMLDCVAASSDDIDDPTWD